MAAGSLALAGPAFASGGDEAFSMLLIGLAVILPVARITGILAERFGQPAVLGELLAGILLGNLNLLGFAGLERIGTDPGVNLLAELGVVLLLFEVGIDSSLGKLLKVGVPALLVACVGVLLPMAMGYGVGIALLPGSNVYVALFLGATLSATSVGITARVLKDLGHLQDAESQIILGAAVIDDVLGLIVLAVVAGLVTAADSGQTLAMGSVAMMIGKAVVFLMGSLLIGLLLASRAIAFVSRGNLALLFAVALALCFGLAWGAGRIGLAPIVGAFAAGLILEGIPWTKAGVSQDQVIDLLHPFSMTLVPLFFVVTGMQVNLAAAANPQVLGLTLGLSVIAFLGKFLAGWAAFPGRYHKLRIGLGMVPRGEVGLIFANVGLKLKLGGAPLLSPDLYAALVLVIFVTTLMTPPLLRAAFGTPQVNPRRAPDVAE
jgi:Kef-type K+ transport system membrane component KefB